MTKEELAGELHGCEYGEEVSAWLRDRAKDSGLVIVYGASDDLVEFDGAICDEAGAFEGGKVYINRGGVLTSECPEGEDCPYFKESQILSSCIEVIWNDGEDGSGKSAWPAWTYETDIPHEEFNVMDEGEVYCMGIVFSLHDVR